MPEIWIWSAAGASETLAHEDSPATALGMERLSQLRMPSTLILAQCLLALQEALAMHMVACRQSATRGLQTDSTASIKTDPADSMSLGQHLLHAPSYHISLPA